MHPPAACRDAQITAQTFYRWRKEFPGLKLDQAKRMKELEKESAKLKRLVAQLPFGGNLLYAEGGVRTGRRNLARLVKMVDQHHAGSVFIHLRIEQVAAIRRNG